MSCIDTLRLSESEQTELLQVLDRDEQTRSANNGRHHQRLSYRPTAGILVSLTHPGGSAALYLVRPRNLSSGGIGFLHGNYLHAGSRCGLALHGPDGSRHTMLGRVAWCRHLSGRIHEVGVAFEQTINVQHFVNTCLRTQPEPAPAPAPQSAASTPAPTPQKQSSPIAVPTNAPTERETSTPMPRLRGRVLHIEDAVDDQALLQFQLGQLGVEMHTAPDAMAALTRLQDETFDLIITGIWLPGLTGLELIDQIREQLQLTTPVLALTADPTEAVHNDARQRGCAQVLVKPYVFETLVEALRRYLGADEIPPRVVSQYWRDPAMRPLIRKFAERLDAQCRQIGAMLEAGQAGQSDPLLRKLCLEMKGTAGSYGYPGLSEAARHFYDLIQCGAPSDELHQQHAQLTQFAKAARAGLEPADDEADAKS